MTDREKRRIDQMIADHFGQFPTVPQRVLRWADALRGRVA